MSDKELDNLFSKKLEGFQANPSPEAWKNIAAGIRPGGINWKFYITIAASLLLVGVITVLMIVPSDESEMFTASEETLTTEQPTTSGQELAAGIATPEESQPEVAAETEVTKQVPKEEMKKASAPAAKSTSTAVVPLLAEKTETSEEKADAVEQLIETGELAVSLEEIQPMEETTGIEAATPVVFTGEKVAVATTETEPEESQRGFSFKKVIEMARDFKSDNDGWSSLREAKNELLTLGRKKNESSDD